MTIHPRDILFYGGGAALQKYGTLSRRTTPIARKGEDVAETFTRTGTAYYIDGQGVLQLAAANLPRINHWGDGARLSTPRLLVEGARTNGWTYSEQLDNAVWTKTLCSISANAVAAADGETTMDKIVEDGTASDEHGITRAPPAMTDDTKQSASFFAMAGERTWVRVYTKANDDTEGNSWVNLSTGAKGTEDAEHTITVETLGGGIYRIGCVFDCYDAGVGSDPMVGLYLATGDENVTYSGDDTSGLYVWGLQFEVDVSFVSSYAQTEAATATRNAETLSFPFWAPPQAMSAYVKFVEAGSILSDDNTRVLHIGSSSGAGNARFQIYVSSGFYIAAHVNDDATTGGSTLSVAPDIGDTVEIRATVNSGGGAQIHQSINSAAETSGDLSGDVPLSATWAGALLYLNSAGAASYGFTQPIAAVVARSSHSLADFRALLP